MSQRIGFEIVRLRHDEDLCSAHKDYALPSAVEFGRIATLTLPRNGDFSPYSAETLQTLFENVKCPVCKRHDQDLLQYSGIYTVHLPPITPHQKHCLY